MYEGFKNTITDFNNELLKNVQLEQAKAKDIQDETINLIVENKISAVDTLKTLEEEHVKSEEKKLLQIDFLNSKIKKLKVDLEEELKVFQKNHDIELLKQKLLTSKEDKLKDLRQTKKKAISDLTQKINSLDKECLLILKEKDHAIAETEKSHKARIIELERRLRIEVQRVNETILTPVPKNVGQIDPEIGEEVQFSKQKIRDIRKKGINEIAKIKTEYLEEIKKEKSNFTKIRLQHIYDSSITRQEYNLKIKDLVLQQEEIKVELQKAFDEYDFDAYIIVNESRKLNLLEEKNITNNYHQNIYKQEDTINRSLDNKRLRNEEAVQRLIEKVEAEDIKQLKHFEKGFNESTNSYIIQINLIKGFILKIKDLYCRLVEDIITEFWNQYYLDEARFVDALIMMTYGSPKFNDIKYKNYINQIIDLQSSYNKMQKQRYAKFKKIFYDNVKILENQFNIIHNTIITYSGSELDASKTYYASLSKIINTASRDNNSFYQGVTATVNSKNQANAKFQINLRDKEINVLRSEIEKINGDYLEEEASIASKKKNYNQKITEQKNSYLDKHNNLIKNIKDAMATSKTKYETDLRTGLKEINNEFKEEIKVIEKERKTKLKIGQI